MKGESMKTDLVTKNAGLFRTIANKHGRIASWMDEEDLMQEMFVRALQAVDSFDPQRGTFSNYMSRIMWRFLHTLRNRCSDPEVYVEVEGFHDGTPSSYHASLLDDLVTEMRTYSPQLHRALVALIDCDGEQRRASKVLKRGTAWMHKQVSAIRDCPVGREVAALI